MGSTWPANSSHSFSPICFIAAMASSSDIVRKLYDCTPIRTLWAACTALGQARAPAPPARASWPNWRRENGRDCLDMIVKVSSV